MALEIKSIGDLSKRYQELYAVMIGGLGEDYCRKDGHGRLIPLEDAYPLLGTSPFEQTSITLEDGNFRLTYREAHSQPRLLAQGSADDILFRALKNAAFELATTWELRHRIETQDCRRQIFPKIVELLAKMNPEWAEREEHAQNNILTLHPYDDEGTIRVRAISSAVPEPEPDPFDELPHSGPANDP